MLPVFPGAVFLGVLAVLLALDALSTVYALTRFRSGPVRAVERNGPLAWLMGAVGVRAALVLVKVACFVLAVLLIAEISTAWRWAIVAVYVAVVINNAVQIYRLRRAVA